MSQVKISELNNAALPLNPTAAFEIALGGFSFQASLQDILDLTSDGTLENLEINVDKDWVNRSITNINILETKTLQIKAVVDSVPIFESTFTQSTIESAQILRMDFEGQNDQSTPTSYAQILVNQDDLSNGSEKGSIDFLVATGSGSPTSMLKLDGVGDGTNPQIQASVDVDMDLNGIIFNDWKIAGKVTNNILEISTVSGNDGGITFTTDEMIFEYVIATVQTSNVISQRVGGDVDTKPAYQTFIGVIPANDPISNTTPIYDIRIQREGGTEIVNRPLMDIRNHLTTEWLLDNDGTVTQFGDLIMSGTNAIVFPDANWRILDTSPSTKNLLFETIDGSIGTIQFENNDFVFQLQLTSEIGFLTKEVSSGGAVSTRPGFLWETQILVDNDVDDEPIILINIDRQGVGTIINRPLFEIQNDDATEWRLNHDGVVTQFGDLDMGGNDINNVNAVNDLSTLTVTGTATVGFLQIDPPTDATVPTLTTKFTEVSAGTPPTEIFTMFFKGQDNVPSEQTYVIIDVQQETLTEGLIQGSIDFSVATGVPGIISLLKIDGKNPDDTVLDPKFGRIIAGADLQMGLFELQFDDQDHYIHQHGTNLEAHVGLNQQFRIVIADPASGFTYQFGTNRSNWGNLGMTGMGAVSFGIPETAAELNVSIQRGSTAFGGTNKDLQLDANLEGEIVLRIFNGTSDDEEYNFGATTANFNNNQISNAVLLSTVTGNTGITGLGILSEIVFVGTDNTIFPKDSNTHLRINANTDLECEVGNSGALVISNRGGSNLFSFSDDRADFLGSDLADMGILSYQSEVTALATFVLTPDKTFTILAAETGTNDILKTINVFGAVNGQTLIITPQSGDSINVEDTDNIVLINDRPWLMEQTSDYMSLIFDGTNWIEKYRTEDHVSSISDGTGISSDFALGNVEISVDSTVISGQTEQDPLDSNFLLFLDGGSNLRKAKFDALQFSIIAGNGIDDMVGPTPAYFSFFGTTGSDSAFTNRQFPMPAKMELKNLTVTIGLNGRSGTTEIAVAINGVFSTVLKVDFLSSEQGITKSATTSITVNAEDEISLFVPGATGNIFIRGFSCLMGQKSV